MSHGEWRFSVVEVWELCGEWLRLIKVVVVRKVTSRSYGE